MRSLRTWIKTLRAIAFIYGGLTNFTQEQHHHSLAHIISSETMAKTNDNDKERRGEGDEEGKQHMVFDLFHDVKRGWDTHYGTIIVQEAPCQVYKIPSLNNTLHYAIRGKANMDRRIKDLVDDGFELLTEQCLRSGDRPRRFLIIVPPGMNITGVKEIEVINDFRALGKEEATGKLQLPWLLRRSQGDDGGPRGRRAVRNVGIRESHGDRREAVTRRAGTGTCRSAGDR